MSCKKTTFDWTAYYAQQHVFIVDRIYVLSERLRTMVADKACSEDIQDMQERLDELNEDLEVVYASYKRSDKSRVTHE